MGRVCLGFGRNLVDFSQNEVLWVSFSTGGSTQDEIVGTQPPLPPEEKLSLLLLLAMGACTHRPDNRTLGGAVELPSCGPFKELYRPFKGLYRAVKKAI